MIKYRTGWAVVPQPAWVGPAQNAMGGLLLFASPPGLWMAYGSGYTIALLLMRGPTTRHTERPYFKPTSNYTTLDPETAAMV